MSKMSKGRLLPPATIGFFMPAVAALMCGTILVLGLTNRSWVPIDLSVETEAVTLQAGNERVELPPFRISRLTVIGDGTIDGVPGVTTFQSIVVEGAPGEPQIDLSLADLGLAPNSRFTLRRSVGVERGFEFIVSNPSGTENEFRVFAQGNFRIKTDALDADLPAGEMTALRINLGGAPFKLSIILAEQEWSLQRPFPIARLDLRDFVEDDLSGLFSAVKTGVVRFLDVESFDGSGRQLDLLPRQMLIIGAIRKGFIRNLSISGADVDIGMTGEVDDLKTVWRELVRDHMPTLLATISSIDPLKKLVAALAIFLALLQVVPPGSSKK